MTETIVWPVVMGGLFIRPVNARIKRGLLSATSQVWRTVFGRKDACEALDVKTVSPDNAQTVDSIQSRYEQYQLAEEGPYHLYIDTKRGLFCVHLPTGRLVQGWPWDTPRVPKSVKTMLQTVGSAQDKTNKLKRFQLNCVLNMLLKDVSHILARDRDARRNVPDCLRRLIQKLSHHDTQQGAECTSEVIGQILFNENNTDASARNAQLEALKHFLRRGTASELFFKDTRAEADDLLRATLRMGMILHSTVLHGVYLFVEWRRGSGNGTKEVEEAEEQEEDTGGPKQQDTSEGEAIPNSLPGEPCVWLSMGRMRYTVEVG
jgi:hypothetical protein